MMFAINSFKDLILDKLIVRIFRLFYYQTSLSFKTTFCEYINTSTPIFPIRISRREWEEAVW